jgi:hypothetical protein
MAHFRLEERRRLLGLDRIFPDPSEPAWLELSLELELESSEGSEVGGFAFANVFGVPCKALSKKFSAANLPGVVSLGRGLGIGILPVFNVVEGLFFLCISMSVFDVDSVRCHRSSWLIFSLNRVNIPSMKSQDWGSGSLFRS